MSVRRREDGRILVILGDVSHVHATSTMNVLLEDGSQVEHALTIEQATELRADLDWVLTEMRLLALRASEKRGGR